MTVRFGVLGVSDVARRRMLPGFARTPGLEVAAIASRSGARAVSAASDYGCASVEGYAQLLERADVDAVYVPLPTALHAEWAERALLAGKHVLVEKPATTSRQRTAELFSLARAQGLVLMENVMFVHHGLHRGVRELIHAGRIGQLRSFVASFAIPRPPGDHVRYRTDLAGGALWELGVYPVRAALHMLRRPLHLIGAVRCASDFAVDVGGAALLCTNSGVAVNLSFGIDHAYSCYYELVGSQGRITVNRAFTPPASHAPRINVADAAGSRQDIVLPPDDQVARSLEAFVGAVARGTERTDTEEVLDQAGLLDQIRHVGLVATMPTVEEIR